MGKFLGQPMKKIHTFSLIATFFVLPAFANEFEYLELNLEDSISWFGDGAHYGGARGGFYFGKKDGSYDPKYNVPSYFSRYYHQNVGLSDRYGHGGYGDPNYVGINCRACVIQRL